MPDASDPGHSPPQGPAIPAEDASRSPDASQDRSSKKTLPPGPEETIDSPPPPTAAAELSTINLDDGRPAIDSIPGTVELRPEEASVGATMDLPPPPASIAGTLDIPPAVDWAAGTVDLQPTAVAPSKASKDPLPRSVAGYEVLDLLGRGAMGVVYKARQPGLNRLVALKMILAGEHAGAHEVARFKAEAEAIAQLQHVNIVQIYEVDEENGRPYFSLEFVDGGSLDRKLAGTPQPPREAAHLMELLASAMNAAHQKGIIHRDLKPANVLLARDGTPKISDFGLAKKLEGGVGQTTSGAILGTPSYMSPEQAEGRTDTIGPAADVYALGVMLYEMLTGRVPFKGPTIMDTLKQVCQREPVAPSMLQDKIPRDLETICLKCLQKEPGKRYQTAGELAEDLRRFLANEPILARPVGRLERAWRWCRRNPLAAAALLGVVVWAGSMSALSWQLKVQKDTIQEREQEANHQKDIALANEKEANFQKNVALDNEKVTRNRYEQSLVLEAKLGQAVLKKLQSRHFLLNGGPEMRSLRDQVVTILADGMTEMVRDIESVQATTIGQVRVHQEIGDLLQGLGRGREALKHYQRGAELARKLAEEQPDNDKAQANLTVLLLRLADMEVELRGDPKAAREYVLKARHLRQDVWDHPRSGDFTELDNKIALSHHELRLGKTELDMGHPSAAWEHFRKLVQLRQAWSDGLPHLPEGRIYLAEGLMWQGICAAHRQDEAGMKEAFGRALDLCTKLMEKYPDAYWYQEDRAEIICWQGDAWLSMGKLSQARQCYEASLKDLRPALARDPEETSFLVHRALTEERLGMTSARAGNGKEADQHFQEALRQREELRLIDPNNLTWQGPYARALAHCGKVAEAASGADALLQRNPKSPLLLVEAARCYGACAAGASSARVKQQYADKAIAALREAVADGYRDRMVLSTDPDLVSLQKTAGYQALLAERH